MTNLKLYINKQDYLNMCGADWPDYEDFCKGAQASDPKTQASIDNFVEMMIREGIRFPLSTATACQSKWTWSTIFLNQLSTASCHRVNPTPFSLENFDNFHNTPKKLQDRRLMLQGKWPTGGCEYCKNIEDAGGSSDRMFHTSIPDMYPPELDVRQDAIEVSPRIVEVYFDNTCNMSCIYCWDGFSSQIYAENKKFGRFEKEGIVIDNHSSQVANKKQLTEQFWSWMQHNHLTVKRFHVLGGEPFYQAQFDRCLDFFKQNPNPELEFNVVSNLKINPDKLLHLLDQIKHLVDNKMIKRFDLTASIDCFGKEQEYVRYGIDLNQWKQNFLIVAEQSWITLNVNQTLSALTIKTVPDLVRFINQARVNREIGHYFSTTVMTHEFLHPGIFGKGFFSDDFDAIIKTMPEETWQQNQAKNYMNGIKLQVDSCTRDDYKIHQLTVFLDEMDRRRNLDWKQTFPWLVQEIKNVVQ